MKKLSEAMLKALKAAASRERGISGSNARMCTLEALERRGLVARRLRTMGPVHFEVTDAGKAHLASLEAPKAAPEAAPEPSAVEQAAAAFPAVFGLKGYAGRYVINLRESYEDGDVVVLYVFTEGGDDFLKGTPAELRGQVVKLEPEPTPEAEQLTFEGKVMTGTTNRRGVVDYFYCEKQAPIVTFTAEDVEVRDGAPMWGVFRTYMINGVRTCAKLADGRRVQVSRTKLKGAARAYVESATKGLKIPGRVNPQRFVFPGDAERWEKESAARRCRKRAKQDRARYEAALAAKAKAEAAKAEAEAAKAKAEAEPVIKVIREYRRRDLVACWLHAADARYEVTGSDTIEAKMPAVEWGWLAQKFEGLRVEEVAPGASQLFPAEPTPPKRTTCAECGADEMSLGSADHPGALCAECGAEEQAPEGDLVPRQPVDVFDLLADAGAEPESIGAAERLAYELKLNPDASGWVTFPAGTLHAQAVSVMMLAPRCFVCCPKGGACGAVHDECVLDASDAAAVGYLARLESDKDGALGGAA